ncbi:hypothetical protein JOQ06_007215, partial [Pogonophryne albipinna]
QSCTCQRLRCNRSISINLNNLKRRRDKERSGFIVYGTLILVDVSKPSLMWNVMLTVREHNVMTCQPLHHRVGDIPGFTQELITAAER